MPFITHFGGHAKYLDIAWSTLKRFSVENPNTLQLLYLSVSEGLIAAQQGKRAEACVYFEDIDARLSRKYILRSEQHRAVGLIAQAAGMYEEAFRYFHQALDHARNASNPVEGAWCCHDWGKALVERGGVKDREKAWELLSEGLKEAGRLRIVPLESRIKELVDVLKTNAKPKYPADLTPRELEVIREITRGKTNQEISLDLSISEHTVANHVKHILAKIGVTNRVDAAMYAVRNGLAGE